LFSDLKRSLPQNSSGMKKSHLFNEHGESDPLALEDSSGKTNTTTNQIGLVRIQLSFLEMI